MASWKGVKEVVEVGHPEGWVRVLDFAKKRDWFGMGYQPSLAE